MPQRTTTLAQCLFDPDPEVRRHAVERAAASKSAWDLRALLLATALGTGATAEEAFKALSARGASLQPLLYLELDGPVPKARALALRLLGQQADLASLERILPCLFDPSVDVREAARRALAAITQATVEGSVERPPDAGALRHAIRALIRTACSNDTSVRKSAITVLLQLSLIAAEDFWKAFGELTERAQQLVQLEFLSAQSTWALPTLYRGFLVGDIAVEERVAALLSRHLPNDDINRHLEQIARLTAEERGRLALALEDHALLHFYTDALPHLRPECAQTLLGLVEFLDLSRHTRFLERCADSPVFRLRARALRLLGRELPASMGRRAREMLRSDDIRELLVGLELLQKEPEREAIADVKPLLEHPSELVRRAAARTTFVVTHQVLMERFSALSPDARERVITQLQRLNPDFSLDLLRRWPETTDEAERVKLAQMLTCMADQAAVVEQLDTLELGASTRVRATLVRLFGRLASPVARLRRLVPLLYDADARVRANAVEELPDDLPAPVIARLKELARSAAARERANAVKRLIELGATEYEVSLVRMVEDPDPGLRASGIWVVGQLGLAQLRDLLFDRLGDDDPGVRAQAVQALGACAPDDELQQLERLLKDEHRRVRFAARDVLRRRLRLAFQVED